MPSATSDRATGRQGGSSRSAARRRDRLHRVARRVAATTWGDRGARAGLAARGLVYLVLAYLVARIAAGALGQGSTSKSASGPGVAQAIAAQDGGRVVLVVLGIGLVCYALFSLLDAVLHHDDESPTAKRWGDRFLSVWGFVVYGGFAGYCLVTAASNSAGKQRASQSNHKQEQWSARVLRWPAGWLWLGGLGVVLLVIAAFLISRCARRSFAERLDRDAMSPGWWRTAMTLGVVGYLGRAGLFAIVGWFVLSAAIEDDPVKGQGVDGSARMLADGLGGAYLLGAIAAALFGYGLYMFVEARYRTV